jgi:hypothetical protein
MDEETLSLDYELTRLEFEEDLLGGRKLSDSEWRIVRSTVEEAMGEAFSSILIAEAEAVSSDEYE